MHINLRAGSVSRYALIKSEMVMAWEWSGNVAMTDLPLRLSHKQGSQLLQ